MNDEPCKLHSLIYLLRGSDACCNNKNNHSKLGSRSPYTHCVYKCASANVIYIESLQPYIVITDPGIHLATTKTVYLFIGQLCVYITDVPIVEIVKEGPTLSWLLNRCSF